MNADTLVSQLLNGKNATNMRPCMFFLLKRNTKLGHITNTKGTYSNHFGS